ncbi:MAG: BrnA antitoxin family protein [Kiritimatiellae bacterium]|nr:BrnA antitoxin family protein [Kiritimatiellia bacterium]
MKAEYDLAKMQSRRNPYAKALKKQLTIRVRPDVVDYFKNMSQESGVPYQTLINLYLQDCMSEQRKLKLTWNS